MAEGRKPDYKVVIGRENGDKTYWTEIGSGWLVKNDGISVQLNSLPVDGKMVLFLRRDE